MLNASPISPKVAVDHADSPGTPARGRVAEPGGYYEDRKFVQIPCMAEELDLFPYYGI